MNLIQFNRGVVNASDCISDGWNLAKQNYGLFFAISLVAAPPPNVYGGNYRVGQ